MRLYIDTPKPNILRIKVRNSSNIDKHFTGDEEGFRNALKYIKKNGTKKRASMKSSCKEAPKYEIKKRSGASMKSSDEEAVTYESKKRSSARMKSNGEDKCGIRKQTMNPCGPSYHPQTEQFLDVLFQIVSEEEQTMNPYGPPYHSQTEQFLEGLFQMIEKEQANDPDES